MGKNSFLAVSLLPRKSYLDRSGVSLDRTGKMPVLPVVEFCFHTEDG